MFEMCFTLAFMFRPIWLLPFVFWYLDQFVTCLDVTEHELIITVLFGLSVFLPSFWSINEMKGEKKCGIS